MRRRINHRHLAAAAVLLAFAGCSSSAGSGTDAAGTRAAAPTTAAPAPTTSVAATTTAAPAADTTTTTIDPPEPTAVATPASCPAGAPADRTCFSIAVAADPATPTGPTLDLAVTVRRADPSTWTSPVIIMAGPAPFYDWTAPVSNPFVGHDLVYVDSRGTGRSDGATHCPDLQKYVGEINALHLGAAAEAAVATCLDTARSAAVPFASLADHALVAADLKAVRQALGIAKWGVFARHGGVNIALQMVNVDPDGISAIGGRSPEVVGSFSLPEDVGAAFDRLVADCSAIPACAAKGDLRQQLAAGLERLTTPVTTKVLDPGGDPVVLDATSLKYAIATALGTPANAKILPDLVVATATGGDDLVAGAFVAAPIATDAVDLLGLCQQQDYLGPGLGRKPGSGSGLFAGVDRADFCAALGAVPQYPAPPAVTSDIPVFEILPSYDGRSSVERAKTIFAGFSKVQIVEAPGISDPNEVNDCYQAVVTAYFFDPTAPLQTACLTSPAVKTLG